MTIDKVFLRAIRLDASLGVLPWEYQVRQMIEVDVEAFVDTAALLRTGDLEKGVDFSVVIQTVKSVAQGRHHELVEQLADELAHAVLQATPAESVRLQVRKYYACAADANHAGVEVVRTKALADRERP